MGFFTLRPHFLQRKRGRGSLRSQVPSEHLRVAFPTQCAIFLVKLRKFGLGKATSSYSTQTQVWLCISTKFRCSRNSKFKKYCFAQNAVAAGAAYGFDIEHQKSELTQANPVISEKLTSAFLLILACPLHTRFIPLDRPFKKGTFLGCVRKYWPSRGGGTDFFCRCVRGKARVAQPKIRGMGDFIIRISIREFI